MISAFVLGRYAAASIIAITAPLACAQVSHHLMVDAAGLNRVPAPSLAPGA